MCDANTIKYIKAQNELLKWTASLFTTEEENNEVKCHFCKKDVPMHLTTCYPGDDGLLVYRCDFCVETI